MRYVGACGLLLWIAAGSAQATLLIDLGDVRLQPGTAGQQVEFYVSGGVDDLVQGLNFYIQIADGGPEAAAFDLADPPGIDGPHITAVDLLGGTIFQGNNDGQYGGTAPLPQLWDATVSTVDGTVRADGLIATVTFDTTQWGPAHIGQSWDLVIGGVAAGVLDLYTGFSGPGPPEWAGEIPTDVINGTITIVAPQLTLAWDGQGSGRWGDIDSMTGHSRWRDEGGNPIAQLPGAQHDVVVDADTVTVDQARQANHLTIHGGSVAISDGATLSLGSLDLAAEATLSFGGGAELIATGAVELGGTLALQRSEGLAAVGDTTETILHTDGVIHGIFDEEPPVGGHLGFGVFHQGVSYQDGHEVDVELFQAAAGDVNGNRQVDNVDMLMILAANSFGNGDGFGWPQGDFDGNGEVDSDDLQLVLGSGLFGTGQYVASASSSGGATVVPEPCAWVMLAGGLAGWLLLRRGAGAGWAGAGGG